MKLRAMDPLPIEPVVDVLARLREGQSSFTAILQPDGVVVALEALMFASDGEISAWKEMSMAILTRYADAHVAHVLY
jgi:hypothetical protein